MKLLTKMSRICNSKHWLEKNQQLIWLRNCPRYPKRSRIECLIQTILPKWKFTWWMHIRKISRRYLGRNRSQFAVRYTNATPEMTMTSVSHLSKLRNSAKIRWRVIRPSETWLKLVLMGRIALTWKTILRIGLHVALVNRKRKKARRTFSLMHAPQRQVWAPTSGHPHSIKNRKI